MQIHYWLEVIIHGQTLPLSFDRPVRDKKCPVRDGTSQTCDNILNFLFLPLLPLSMGML